MSKRAIGAVLISVGLLGVALSMFAMSWLSFWHSFPRADGGSYAEVHPLRWRALMGGVLLCAVFAFFGAKLVFPRHNTGMDETGRKRQDQ